VYGEGFDDSGPDSGRGRKLARKQALWNERASWLSHWQEISEYQQPRAGRFSASDRNRGDKKRHNILDNTAVFASRTLAAGMMSGMTSPARPWFRLEIPDKKLMESEAVKTWLFECQAILRRIFAASNTYRTLHGMYEELGLFGTAASVVLPDFENVIHHYPMTVGEYALGHNDKGFVDTLCREYQMTVGQMVKQFGYKNCSTTVKNLWDRRAFDQWVTVIHLVEPRAASQRDMTKRDGKNMPFSSCYFEPSKGDNENYLSESGFKAFPVLAPRWILTGNDIYGHSPGMDVLGDVKQLQHQQLRKGQAIDYQVNPPLQVPTAYKEAQRSRLPGGIFYVDAPGPGTGVRTAYDVTLNMQHLLMDIQDVRDRIRQGYYADLFLMLANDTRSGTTATEITERHEEKLLALGPVLERLHNELLSPLIDMAFDRASQAGILPPAPRELEGMDIQVEFISVLAQAQRAVAAGGVDRLLSTVGSVAGLAPGVVDKIDFDQVVDDYADMFGVNPKLIVSDAKVAEMRSTRAAQQAQQAQAAAMPAVVDTAKVASEINTAGMQDVLGLFSGYASPTPTEVAQ